MSFIPLTTFCCLTTNLEVLEDNAWPENSLLASAILTVTIHSGLWTLPQPFQHQPPTMSNTVPCTSEEFFVSLQCCETQTQVPVNLRPASLPGKVLTKQTGDKPSLLHLCSGRRVSGLGDKSTIFMCTCSSLSRDRLLSSSLFSSAVNSQAQFRSYLHLHHLLVKRKPTFQLIQSKSRHASHMWLAVNIRDLRITGFAVTIVFCSS